MNERSPEREREPWSDESPPGDEMRFESVGDAMRSAPPPPEPSASHLARLNLRVLERVERERGMRRLWGRWTEALAGLWFHPAGQRSLLVGGAAAVMCIGLVVGTSLGPQGSGPVASAPRPAANRLLEAPPADFGAGERLFVAEESEVWSVESVTGDGALSLAPQGGFYAQVTDEIQPVAARGPANPFPSVYLRPRQSLAETSDSSSRWVTYGAFANAPELGTDDQMTRSPESDSSLASGSDFDPALERVAGRIVEEDMLGDLRRLKLDLYLSGANGAISGVQGVEDLLHEVLATQAGRDVVRGVADLESQRLFAEAERHLISRDFRRAEELFNEMAHSHGGSRLAALSWYHLGNIYLNFHTDYAGARQCFRRCVAPENIDVFPPEIAMRIEHHLALLDDAAPDAYEPLTLLRLAEAAPTGQAVAGFRNLLDQYPASEAAADAINTLAERAMREVPEHPGMPQETIGLLRHYQALPDARHATLAQIRLADIVFFGLHDYPQAMIEYGRIELDPDDPSIEEMVRDRVAQILDTRVAQR